MSSVHDGLPIGTPGGCAAKLRSEFIEKVTRTDLSPTLRQNVLVGPESKDDAAVYRLDDQRAIVLTLDFGSPFCRDPIIFGAITAANALSDIYAMGGRPFSALAILSAPENLPEQLLLLISEGAAETCASVGVPIVGGHSAEGSDLMYGLSVAGVCHPNHFVRNCTARPGDKIILTKPLGFGVYAQALAKDVTNNATAREAWKFGRQLNTVGAELAERDLVNAMTDVTGFGLLGHVLEMAEGSKVRANLVSSSVPVLPDCQRFLEAGLSSGAGLRNQTSVKGMTKYDPALPGWLRYLLTEPETNGGLLLSVPAAHVGSVLQTLQSCGFRNGAVVGEFSDGPIGIEVS